MAHVLAQGSRHSGRISIKRACSAKQTSVAQIAATRHLALHTLQSMALGPGRVQSELVADLRIRQRWSRADDVRGQSSYHLKTADVGFQADQVLELIRAGSRSGRAVDLQERVAHFIDVLRSAVHPLRIIRLDLHHYADGKGCAVRRFPLPSPSTERPSITECTPRVQPLPADCRREEHKCQDTQSRRQPRRAAIHRVPGHAVRVLMTRCHAVCCRVQVWIYSAFHGTQLEERMEGRWGDGTQQLLNGGGSRAQASAVQLLGVTPCSRDG